MGSGCKGAIAASLLFLALAAVLWLPKGRRQPTAVVLIVVDALRADHLGLYGYERATSPNLDAWSREGVVFERALAPSDWTLPAFGTLYTGQSPLRHGAGGRSLKADDSQPADLREALVRAVSITFTPLRDSIPTLAEILRDHGYATGAVVNNPVLHANLGLQRGFQTYNYRHHRRASGSVDVALAWLDSHLEERLFLLLHIMDAHMDYDAPEPVRGRFTDKWAGQFDLPVSNPIRIRAEASQLSESERAFIIAAYDEEVAFVDDQLGRFFDGLRERGIFDRGLIILTADHGEELFDHGGFEHGHTLYQELLHVPLVMWAPGTPPRRVAEPVGLIDVLPTVLDGLGLEKPEKLPGASLWPTLVDGHTPPERGLLASGTLYGRTLRAWIRWPWKLITEIEGDRIELFNLQVDPREGHERSSERPELLRAMLAELLEVVSLDLDHPPGEPVELTDDAREQMRALGYTQ